MILSASRRTDLPAFHGEFLLRVLASGLLLRTNQRNRKPIPPLRFGKSDVSAIVLWTKNPAPFLPHLEYLDREGYSYYFQFTLNAYPFCLEPKLPLLEERLDTFIALAQRIGRERVIWRYDPIIASDQTDESFHARAIRHMAGRLRGHTRRLIISFYDDYGFATKRLLRIPGFRLRKEESNDPGWQRQMAVKIKDIASDCGMEVFTCAEALPLEDVGIRHSSCVDCGLINELFGLSLRYRKDRSQRKTCGCTESVDVGLYNTCLHGCGYCYANTRAVTEEGYCDGYEGMVPDENEQRGLFE